MPLIIFEVFYLLYCLKSMRCNFERVFIFSVFPFNHTKLNLPCLFFHNVQLPQPPEMNAVQKLKLSLNVPSFFQCSLTLSQSTEEKGFSPFHSCPLAHLGSSPPAG